MAARMELRFFVLFVLLFIFLLICLSKAHRINGKVPPVILVPGDGGTQIWAMLNKTTSVHYICTKKTADYFPLWLNLELMAPYVLDCFVDNMRLVYNRKTGRTTNSPGVHIKIKDFGNTSSVEWLDSSDISVSSYFAPIVEASIFWGYQRGYSIRAAPYDFRKAPSDNPEWFVAFKKLIEDAYYKNGNKQVVLLGHSMGNLYTLHFLNTMKQNWKDKFIRSFVSLSGPWGGAAKILRLMASGDNLNIYILNPLTIRPEQRSMTSSAFLMPYESFWDKDLVLVSSPSGNYTVKDYKKFFHDINYMDGWDMRQQTVNTLKDLVAPGVEVHCLHGVHVDTPSQFHYTADQWPDVQPEVIYSNGDGTVNLWSLTGCLRWSGKQKQPVHHQTFEKVTHMSILNHPDVMDYLHRVFTAK